MTGDADFRVSLAKYQLNAVDAMAETLRTVSALHDREPEHRKRISRETFGVSFALGYRDLLLQF
jgi:hypothetical protein